MNPRHIATTAPRFVAVLALGAAVALGVSGCAMISTQATKIPYSPADGVNVPNSSGVLEVRNALVVADESGTDGNLVAAIVNNDDEPHDLNIEYGDDGGGGTVTIRVRAGEVLSLGDENTDPLLLEDIDTKPGATLPVFFQSGDGDGALVMVPVLDGSLHYLADLVP